MRPHHFYLSLVGLIACFSTSAPLLGQQAISAALLTSRVPRGGAVVVQVSPAQDMKDALLRLSALDVNINVPGNSVFLVPVKAAAVSAQTVSLTFVLPAVDDDGLTNRNAMRVGAYRVVLKSAVLGGSFPVPQILQVTTEEDSKVTIDNITPMIATTKSAVTVTGTGFSVEDSDNELLINGTTQDIKWLNQANFVSTLASLGDCKTPDSKCKIGYIASNRQIVVSSDVFSKPSDVVAIRVGDKTSPSLTGVAVTPWRGGSVKLAAAVVAIALWLILFGLVWKGARVAFGPGLGAVSTSFLLDAETNTYSLSKFQFLAWTFAAVFGYSFLALSRMIVQHRIGLPPIPDSLPGILAISTGTTIGAVAATSTRGAKGSGEITPRLSDFVTSGGVVAPERVQFFVWTIIAVTGFIMAVFLLDYESIETLPSVPESLLILSGVSAFGYLGGKLASKPGPVIAQAGIVAYNLPPGPGGAGRANANFGNAFQINVDGRGLSTNGKFTTKIGNTPEQLAEVPHFVFGASSPDLAVGALDASTGISNPQVIVPDTDAGDSFAKSMRIVLRPPQAFQTGDKVDLKITNPDGKYAVANVVVP